MEARIKGIVVACLALCSVAATEKSTNFVVTAPTREIAQQVARQAEVYRYKLAIEWTGKPLPNWRQPCVVNVKVGQIGHGGATTFVFNGNSVGDYKMNIQGPLDRVLDSVLPHEVNHTIFAEYFRRPMPRWADEGAATFVEDEMERRRQMTLAMQVLRTPRRIPLRKLLTIMEYPQDMQDVLHLYAEGYVLAELLIQQGGRGKFLQFLNAANKEGWDRALHQYYRYGGVDPLERDWNQWVLAGCPQRQLPEGTQLADAGRAAAGTSNPTMRSQAPDREEVSIEDLATTEPSLTPRRGEGLVAPAPNSRAADPSMLKNLDLGQPTQFAYNTQDQPTADRGNRRRLAPPVEPQVERLRASQNELAYERQAAPRTRDFGRNNRNVAASPRVPALRPDARASYGRSQPFPGVETGTYADRQNHDAEEYFADANR